MGRVVVMSVCIMAVAGMVAAAEEPLSSVVEESGNSPVINELEDGTNLQTIEMEEPEPDGETEIEPIRHVEASAGYRFVGTKDSGVRAGEYDFQRSSFRGDARLVHLGKDLKIDLDGTFLNRKDYSSSLMFDYAGYYRLTARTESLFHNLDQVRGNGAVYDYPDTSSRLGLTTRQDEVRFRYKLRDYPIHLDLGHWLIDRSGTSQLRYADFSFSDYFSGPGNSRLHSRDRIIERLSHEGSVGLDAHLGPVNVVYSFQIRQLDDRKSAPVDNFPVTGGTREHNGDPESRFYSHTVKLYTSPAGGITGAASFSYGRRDNISSLATVRGADDSRDTLRNLAGDFTYSPCAWFTAAFKYRHLEIDRDTPSMLYVPSFTDPNVLLRPGIDTNRDIFSANFTIRPNTVLSLNGEYRGIFESRDNTGSNPGTSWKLPENSATHKGNLTLLFRPFKGLRLRGLYEYTTTDHPVYDTQPEQKHEGRILVTYNSSGRWGVNANYRVAKGWNHQISRTTDPSIGTPESYLLPRHHHFTHTSLGFWLSPLERFTLSGNFGFLRTRADQAVLLSHRVNGKDAASEYVSQAEVYSMSALYRLEEDLDFSIAYQLVRSRSDFKLEELTSDGITTTSGIRELSGVKTLEHSFSTRLHYRLTRNFGCTIDYTLRSYDNMLSLEGEGTIHAVTALLKTTW